MTADPHGRLALPEQPIDGHTLEQLHGWLYAQLVDNVPRSDLRYLAGTVTDAPWPPAFAWPRKFHPGDRLFGVLVV